MQESRWNLSYTYIQYDCKLLRSYESLSVLGQMRENQIAVRSDILLMQQNQGGFWGTMWMSAVLFEENNSNMSRMLRVHAFELLVVFLSLYQCDSSSFPSIMACDHPEPFDHFPLAEMATRLQLRSACWCLRTVSRHCLQIWDSLLPRDRSRHDSHSKIQIMT